MVGNGGIDAGTLSALGVMGLDVDVADNGTGNGNCNAGAAAAAAGTSLDASLVEAMNVNDNGNNNNGSGGIILSGGGGSGYALSQAQAAGNVANDSNNINNGITSSFSANGMVFAPAGVSPQQQQQAVQHQVQQHHKVQQQQQLQAQAQQVQNLMGAAASLTASNATPTPVAVQPNNGILVIGGAPVPVGAATTTSLSMSRSPKVIWTASATAWQALIFLTSCALPCKVSVPSQSNIMPGLIPIGPFMVALVCILYLILSEPSTSTELDVPIMSINPGFAESRGRGLFIMLVW
jgi:hypothetical protein